MYLYPQIISLYLKYLLMLGGFHQECDETSGFNQRQTRTTMTKLLQKELVP